MYRNVRTKMYFQELMAVVECCRFPALAACCRRKTAYFRKLGRVSEIQVTFPKSRSRFRNPGHVTETRVPFPKSGSRFRNLGHVPKSGSRFRNPGHVPGIQVTFPISTTSCFKPFSALSVSLLTSLPSLDIPVSSPSLPWTSFPG